MSVAARPAPARVSIVVPVLNEGERLGRMLAQIGRLHGPHEVIVVDGGSSDRTVEIAGATPGCRVVQAPRGRARQMNAGARAASGDVFWFVHADSSVTPAMFAALTSALDDPAVHAGAFRIRTVADRPGHWVGRWLWLADLRSRYTRLPYGDQALFVRRAAFERAGGFPDQPLFEDLEIGRRLRRAGFRLRPLPVVVEVSGRRFLARPFYYAALMNVLPVLYRLGVPPLVLARTYRAVR